MSCIMSMVIIEMYSIVHQWNTCLTNYNCQITIQFSINTKYMYKFNIGKTCHVYCFQRTFYLVMQTINVKEERNFEIKQFVLFSVHVDPLFLLSQGQTSGRKMQFFKFLTCWQPIKYNNVLIVVGYDQLDRLLS